MTLIQPLKKEENPFFFNQQTTTFYEGAAAIKNDLQEGNEFNDQGGKTKSTLTTSLAIILPEDSENLSMEELIRQTFNEQLPEDGSEISFEKRDQSFAYLKPQRKETKISPPPYLFVDVKRHGFSQERKAPYKIDNKIDFNKEFTIPLEFTLDGKEAKYRWVSFGLHSGGTDDGHYVAYVYDENGYHYYSDATKETISQEQFLQAGQEFYLGFAERIRDVDPLD
jgi:ubiquitin C-terminal hydrolase